MFKSNLFFVLLLILFSLLATKSLFLPGYFTSHDGWHQVARLYYFNKSLMEGNLIPSYISQLYYGYGYPLFIFNYLLPWYLAQVFISLGQDIFEAIKSVYIFGFIASSLTMYYYLKTNLGKLESFVGSLLYVYTPYRFSNIFVRGSVGEATIFIFIPLVLLSIDKIIENQSKIKYLVLGSVSVAAIILSHAIGAFLILAFLGLYSLIRVVILKNFKILIPTVSLFILGILLSSFYLFPAFILKSSTMFDQYIQGTRVDGQWATINELIYSRWGFGFANGVGGGMSFQIGIANWIVVFLTALLVINKIIKKNITETSRLITMLMLFIIGVFLIMPQSLPLWDLINKFFFVDFHWRLLSVTVFTTAVMSAIFLSIINKPLKLLLALFIVFVALYTNRNHQRVNEYTFIPLSLYIDSEDTTNTYDEYLSKWVNKEYLENKKTGGLLISSNGNVILPKSVKTASLSYEVENLQEEKFVLNVSYFPGWNLYLDGVKTPLDFDDNGLIQFTVPSGSHNIDIEYIDTNVVKISKFITLFSALALIYLYYKFRKSV